MSSSDGNFGMRTVLAQAVALPFTEAHACKWVWFMILRCIHVVLRNADLNTRLKMRHWFDAVCDIQWRFEFCVIIRPTGL
jgi:hypothetical protein